MRRREFLVTGSATLALTGISSAGGAGSPPRASSTLDRFNYVAGTQAIGATYQFTRETLLVEMAQAIAEMGSNVLKIAMGRDYQRMMLKASRSAYPETMQYLLNQGADAKDTPRVVFPGASTKPPEGDAAIRNLTDLASLDPSYRRVLRMPFSYYLFWTYAFTPRWWSDGFPAEEQEKEYREIYQFVVYLLRTFRNTGKTFYLGHWEGDWHLRPDLHNETDQNVSTQAIQGMIAWLKVRQRAVDDAKRDTPHAGVQVYHYSEVNHVLAVSMEGRKSVTNNVLPEVDVDFVSYSTYDAISGDIAERIPRGLSYIESRLHPKESIRGKRVFIGEYGFPARLHAEPERDRLSRSVMRAGLEWGCPFVLCWQMYNNEYADGRENGYWLIDDQGAKQPLWQTHHSLYLEAARWAAQFRKKERRPPRPEEYRRFALGALAPGDR